MKKMILASMIGLAIGSVNAASLHILDDAELAQVDGQALLNFSKNDYAYNTSSGNVNFFKLGLDVEMELNSNIKSLQLGCGGINSVSQNGCDIEIHNLSLSGLPDNFDPSKGITGDSVYSNGRAATSAKVTNPFIEFAIKNGDQASTREIVGFRLGADEIFGLLSMGTDNIDKPEDGIRSFSGYMKMAATKGDVTTKQSKFGISDAQEIEGKLKALGKEAIFRSNHENAENKGITVPSIKVEFAMPETVVSGKRMNKAIVENIYTKIPQIPLAAGSGMQGINDSIFSNDQLYVEFDALVDILGLKVGDHAKFKMSAGAQIKDLEMDITFTQALSMIHNIPLTGTGGYLSLQKEGIKWADSDVNDIAQTGWWMSFKDPINLGYLKTVDPIDISGVLPQVADLVTALMMSPEFLVDVPVGQALGSVLGVPIERPLNLDMNKLPVATSASIALTSQILSNQNVVPNCFGNYKFC